MNWRKSLIFFIAPLFLFSCGIEEYYYLPQVPEDNIGAISVDSATITLPHLTQYYATNYSIFYRIYISNHLLTTSNEKSEYGNINSQLLSDYNGILPYADPTNTTSATGIDNVFKNRNYFELEVDGEKIDDILTTNGGLLTLRFPTLAGDKPYLTFNDINYNLKRSSEINYPQGTSNDLSFFFYSAELNDNSDNTNADIRTGTLGFAYVSMYIVAVGYDSAVSFSPIYSKPTHISVFKLSGLN